MELVDEELEIPDEAPLTLDLVLDVVEDGDLGAVVVVDRDVDDVAPGAVVVVEPVWAGTVVVVGLVAPALRICSA